MRRTGFPHTARLLATLAVLAFVIAPSPASAGQRVCHTATIEERFVLPDDSEHPPGSLKICEVLGHSRSDSYLVSYVDGMQVSLLAGTRGHNESGDDTEPFMIFARDAKNRLHLYGYGLRGRDGIETFLLSHPGRAKVAVRTSVRGTSAFVTILDG